MFRDAADQEFQAHQRFAAAGAAADQRRPAARKAAAGDGIETLDAGGAFLQHWRRCSHDCFLGATHGRCLSLWTEVTNKPGGERDDLLNRFSSVVPGNRY